MNIESNKIENQEIETEVKNARKGIALVEVLLSLVILALVVGGAMWLFSQTGTSQKTTQFTQEVATIVQAVHQLYQGQPSYAGLSSAIVAQSGLLAARYVNGSTVLSPFGATVNITNGGSPGTSGVTNYFQIDMGTAPQAACARIVTTDYGDGLLSRTGNQTDGTAVTPDQVATVCPAGSASSNLTFTFS